MKRDNRIWVPNGSADYPVNLVDTVRQNSLPGVFTAPGMTTPCHLWLGEFSGNSGYGQVEFKISDHGHRCKMGTHVLMLRDDRDGEPLAFYEVASHLCDVRSCNNPRHLTVATRRGDGHMRSLRGPAASPMRLVMQRETEAQIELRQHFRIRVPQYLVNRARQFNMLHLLEGAIL
jgi:hypothetical protein